MIESFLDKYANYLAFMAIVGVYLIILSHDRRHYFDKIRSKGKTATGIVTELISHPDAEYDKTKEWGFAPVVTFDHDWGNHRYVSGTYQHPSPYHVGQEVKVWYYFYKSRREVALADDVPGDTPAKLLKWGIIFCAMGGPILLWRISKLF